MSELVLGKELSVPAYKSLLLDSLWLFHKQILQADNPDDRMGPAQQGLCSLVDEWDKFKKLILIPRGHLKSATITVGYSVQQVCRNPNVRILIGSETNAKAKDFLKQIRDTFERNERLRHFFGDHVRRESRWTDDEITSGLRKSTSVKEPTVFTTGTDQTRTGSHCDIAIIDDPTSHTNLSEDARRKTLNWYREIANNILDPGGKLIIIGTRWHFGDLYQHIMEEQADFFDIHVKQALTDEGYDLLRKPIPLSAKEKLITPDMILFPEKFTVQRLWEIYSGSSGEGGIEFFNNQYMNRIISSEDADFRESNLQWYSPAELKEDLNTYILIDPAISETARADFTAIVVVGVNKKNDWYVLSYDNFKGKPNEIIDRTFKMQAKYKARRIGIETVAYQKSLVYAFKDEMRSRGISLPLVEAARSTRVSKEMRIKGILQPIIEQRRLYLQEGMIELREQLRTYPRAKNDDLLDALAMLGDIQSGFHGKKAGPGEPETREQKDDREAARASPQYRGRFTRY